MRRTRLRPAQGGGAAAHPRGPEDRPRESRRAIAHHPRREADPADRARRPDEPVRPLASSRRRRSSTCASSASPASSATRSSRSTPRPEADRALPSRSSPTSARSSTIIVDELRELKETLRRRAPHRDRRRGRRDLDRGPDRRRGHGRHDLPRGLHQAEPGRRSTAPSGAAAAARSARRRATRTSSSTSSSPRRTPTSCSSPRAARSTGSRCTRSRRPGARRAARRSSTCSACKRGEDLRLPAGARVPGRPLRPLRDRRGLVKKTDLMAVREPAAAGHHRDRARRGRRGHRRAPDRRRSTRSSCRPRRPGDPLRGDDVRPMGRDATACAASRSTRATQRRGARPGRARRRRCSPWPRTATASAPTIDEYRLTHRGGKGIITMKTTDKTGRVVGVRMVTDDDQIMLVTDGGKVIRMPVNEIRVIGRNTQGVRLIDLERGRAGRRRRAARRARRRGRGLRDGGHRADRHR